MNYYLKIINDLVSNKKAKSPEAVWIGLCKAYTDKVDYSNAFYRKPRDYLILARSFLVIQNHNPDNPDFIAKLNRYFRNLKLDPKGAFAKMLRIFLACYPEYLPRLHENITRELAVQAYNLPVAIEPEQIIQALERSDTFVPAAQLVALNIQFFSDEQLLSAIIKINGSYHLNYYYEDGISYRAAHEVLDQIYVIRPDMVTKIEDYSLERLQNLVNEDYKSSESIFNNLMILCKICERPGANVSRIVSALTTRQQEGSFFVYGKIAQSQTSSSASLVRDLVSNLITDNSETATNQAAFYILARISQKSGTIVVMPGPDLNALIPPMIERFINSPFELDIELNGDLITRTGAENLAFALSRLALRTELGFTSAIVNAFVKKWEDAYKIWIELGETLIAGLVMNEPVDAVVFVTNFENLKNFVEHTIMFLGAIGEKSNEEDATLVISTFIKELQRRTLNIDVSKIRSRLNSQDTNIQLQDNISSPIPDSITKKIINALDKIITLRPDWDWQNAKPHLLLLAENMDFHDAVVSPLNKIFKESDDRIMITQVSDLMFDLKDTDFSTKIKAAYRISEFARIHKIIVSSEYIINVLIKNINIYDTDYKYILVPMALRNLAPRPEVDVTLMLPVLMAQLKVRNKYDMEYVILTLGEIAQRKDVDSSKIVKAFKDILIKSERVYGITNIIHYLGRIAIADPKIIPDIVNTLMDYLKKHNSALNEIFKYELEEIINALVSFSEVGDFDKSILIPALLEVFEHQQLSFPTGKIQFEAIADRIVFIINNRLSQEARSQVVYGILLSKTEKKLSQLPNDGDKLHLLYYLSILKRVCHESALRHQLVNDYPTLPTAIVNLIRSYS